VPARIERVACCVLVVVGACLLPAPCVHAQPPERAVEFEDLGLTRGGDLSARAAGISAFAPAAGDPAALIYNPAGLCRIKKRVPQLGFSYDAQEIVTEYAGQTSGLSSDRTGLLFAGGAFPIPVLRGSLVPAVAIHRIFVSDLDLEYDTDNALDQRHDTFRIQQAGATYAFAFGFGIDLASVLSAGLSLSLFEGGYTALRQSHTRTEFLPAPVDRYVIDDVDGDLDGYVARVGMMLYAHRHAHIGINVTSPTVINHATNETREVTEVVENGTGSSTRTTIATSTEYISPFRLDGGIEMPWGDWLVSVQAGTCDWTEAALDQGRLRLRNGNAVLGRTVDARAGIEWTAPRWPLRLRAGVARLPWALDYVQADRIDNDQLQEVLTETTPMRYSFGAGVLLKRAILIDAAFTHTRGDRSAASFSEARRWSQVVIEGSYWF
jgi:hypothetical protein